MILETISGPRTLNRASKPYDPWGAYSALQTATYAGKDVTPEGALALVAVYGGVSLIAEANGTMPLETIDERAASGSRVVRAGWMAPMLRYQPNADMSGVDLWTMVNAHLLLRGNAYLAKIKDAATGRVSELYPLHPANVHPFRDKNGVKLFRVDVVDGTGTTEEIYTADSILHIKGKSVSNPLVGESPIAAARNTIGTQLAQVEYQARAYQDGMTLKGVLTVPQMNISPDAAERIKQQWRSAYGGISNGHDIAVLHSGATFNPVSMSPEDAQFIQTMKWTHTQIATLLKIPASRLNGEGASLTYANQGQDDLFFDKQACLPLRIMIEQALNRDPDLFGYTSPWVPKFNEKEQLRADDETRARIADMRLRNGSLSVNEYREFEDEAGIGTQGDTYGGVADAAPGGGMGARGGHEIVAPAVRVEMPELPAPVVNVSVPEQAAPVVNVEPPQVRVDAPQVTVTPTFNVEPPQVQVDVAAPDVRIDPNITIEQPAPAKRVVIERDRNGRITGATTKERY